MRTSSRRRRCGSWPRSPTSTCSSPPPSIRCSRPPSTSSASAARPSTEVLSYAPNRVADLPAERDQLQRPVVYHLFGKRLGLADLRDLRRGPARIHLRAAERAPGAGEAVPRARAQPPAVHRQQFHQLAGAPVPAHGQAPAPVRSARRRRGHGGRPHQRRTSGWWPSCSRSACARASTRAPSASSTSCTRAGTRAASPRLRRAGGRAAALPAAGARDAGQRGVHQLRARGSARRAADQGRARSGRHHHLVRHGPARGRRRLRPQDPAQHRALLLLHSGGLGHHAAAPRGLLPARVELRDRPRAQHGRRRAVHPAGDHRRHERRPKRWCPDKFKALHFTQLPGGKVPPEFAQRLRDFMRARAADERAAEQTAAATDDPTIDRPQSLAGPRLVHRGNARLFLRPRRGSRRARAARAAQAADRAVRPVGPRQDLDPARRAGAAPARPGLLPGLRAHRLRPRMRPSRPSRSSRPSPAPRAGPANGRRPASPSQGESLWEFLHHRDDVLRDESGNTLHPAADLRSVRGDLHARRRATTSGRARAARFIADLADLVENRPPAGARGASSRRTTRRPSASISRAATTAS